MRFEWTNRFLNSRVFDALALSAVVAIGFSGLVVAVMIAAFFATGLVVMVEELILF
jgi:hypothetical protein